MNAPITSPAQNKAQSTSSTTSQQSYNDKIVPPVPQPTKTSSTDPFLRDFTLVAEAAKRAQMAVLMRDMESVGLS